MKPSLWHTSKICPHYFFIALVLYFSARIFYFITKKIYFFSFFFFSCNLTCYFLEMGIQQLRAYIYFPNLDDTSIPRNATFIFERCFLSCAYLFARVRITSDPIK